MAAVKRSTRVLLVSGLALSAFGLAGGPWAQAVPAPAPTYHWCPGDQWDPSWGKAYDWDWDHCHDGQGQTGPAGFGPRGVLPTWAPPQPPPPPWAPGALVIWNQTANGWGFWNNRIWTPI